MNNFDITKYFNISSTSWDIIGTPYSIDMACGVGRYRYFKVTKTHSPYYKEEIRVDFEEVFEGSPIEVQEYLLFNLDAFRFKPY